jgi:hypothetical protein
MVIRMSIVNEVKHEEEIKRKLKSRPALPPMIHESREAPSLKAQQSIEIEITEPRRMSEEYLPILQPPLLRPLTIRPKTLTYEELKEVDRGMGPSTLRTIQVFKATSIELKPKMPRAQGVEGLKVEEPQVLVEELPRELKASLKPLRPAVIGGFKSEPLTTPMVKLPQVSVEAQRMTARVIPRQINVEMSASEGVGIQAEILREPSKSLEEEVSLPPLFEELSSIAKPIGRPVCIVLSKRENDSFAMSVAIACREIYRIVKGGKPTPRYISKGLKDEIERLKAEGMVFIVDDSECEFLPELSRIRSCRELIEKVDMDMVFDRLREFFSQDFGFVIFHVNERWAAQFANLLREKVGAFVDIVEVRAPHLSPQAKEVLARACWGFVKGGEGQTFDELFGNCEKEFFNKLKKVGGDIGLAYYVKRDEGASDEHEEMKMFVVECLARELGAKSKEEILRMLEDGKIETETERELRNRGRVDVYVNVPSRQRYVEVETFYGTGDPIIKKLKETLSKYEGIARQVDLVLLTGLQALLYARRLFELADFYRKKGLEVNFYVPNLEEKRLVPLKEMLHMLREVLGPSRQAKLTEDDVEKLWVEFSNALRERGMNPEEYRRLFNIMIDRSRPYEDNLRWMLEEVEALRGQ